MVAFTGHDHLPGAQSPDHLQRRGHGAQRIVDKVAGEGHKIGVEPVGFLHHAFQHAAMGEAPHMDIAHVRDGHAFQRGRQAGDGNDQAANAEVVELQFAENRPGAAEQRRREDGGRREEFSPGEARRFRSHLRSTLSAREPSREHRETSQRGPNEPRRQEEQVPEQDDGIRPAWQRFRQPRPSPA